VVQNSFLDINTRQVRRLANDKSSMQVGW